MKLKSPEALAEVADTWAELMEFRSAIRLYGLALERGGSNVTIRSIEQLGNLLSRRAQQLHRRGVAKHAVDVYMKRSQTWLKRALELGTTGERLALDGRFPQTSGDDDHRRRTRRAPLRRHPTSSPKHNGSNPRRYHQLNWIQLVEVAKLNDIEPGEFAGDLRSGRRRLRGAPSECWTEGTHSASPDEAEVAPDFWTRRRGR